MGRRVDPLTAPFRAAVDKMLNNLTAPFELREFSEKALKKSSDELSHEVRLKTELTGWMDVAKSVCKTELLNGLHRMTYTSDGWVETGYMTKRQWKSAICKMAKGALRNVKMLARYVKEYERKYGETVPVRHIRVAYPVDWAEFEDDDES